MKKFNTTIVTLATSSFIMLSSANVMAMDENKADNSFNNNSSYSNNSSVKEVNLQNLPKDVRNGSIKLTDNEDDLMIVNKAKIDVNQAINVAGDAVKGKVVEIQLDEDDNYLVWEVTTIQDNGNEVELKIDAGNGKILASESEKADKDDSWKFWK